MVCGWNLRSKGETEAVGNSNYLVQSDGAKPSWKGPNGPIVVYLVSSNDLGELARFINARTRRGSSSGIRNSTNCLTGLFWYQYISAVRSMSQMA